MTEIIAAVAGIIGTIIVSIFTYFMARRAGIGPYQDTIVTKLKDLVDIQANEISKLKEDYSKALTRIESLEKEVSELRNLTVDQALQINRLSISRQRRNKAIPKEGEV